MYVEITSQNIIIPIDILQDLRDTFSKINIHLKREKSVYTVDEINTLLSSNMTFTGLYLFEKLQPFILISTETKKKLIQKLHQHDC